MFESTNDGSLKNIVFKNLNNFSVEREYIILPLSRLFWMLENFIYILYILGWALFMANITTNE